MGSLSFEPSDKDIAFVEALLEGINEYSKKLSATQKQEELTMNNKNKYKEAKLHHCDCNCPDCSPESYATESDFEENPWTENKIDEKLGK